MATKILIHVKGGIVQSVNSSNPDIRIVIVDEDNIVDERNGFISEPLEPDGVFKHHYEAFTDETDPVEMEIRDTLKRMKF